MIKELELNNFRSFSKTKLQFEKPFVIIIGENGIGKTTILEALSILSVAKSHQTKSNYEMIRYNSEYAKISGLDELNNEYKVVLSKKGKTCFYQKKEIKVLSEYIGRIPSIYFCPHDMELIKGSPNLRRNFFNLYLCQNDKKYLKNLSTYNSLLKERNLILKGDLINDKYLDTVTLEMEKYAKEIIVTRNKYIEKINSVINKIHKYLNKDETVRIEYVKSVDENNFYQEFQKHLEIDKRLGQTDLGIQRDDFIFYLNDKDSSKYASLGQIRSIILSLNLALCSLYKEEFNKYPLVLLDDVFGELDKTRINNLLNIILKLDQVIITSTDLKNVEEKYLDKFQIINMRRD